MNRFVKKTGELLRRDVTKSEGIFVLAVAALLALNVLLYVLTEAFGLYLYEVEESDLSISGNTDALFESAAAEGKKIKIYFCQSEDKLLGHDTGLFVYKTAKEFEARYPEFVELDYINIMTKRRDSDGELVDLTKYQKDMRGVETYVLKTSVIFESGDNYRVVTDAYTSAGYADFFTLDSSLNATSYNGEEVMAAMMSWVLSDEHETAYFTQYHGESVDVAFTNLLSCAGFYIDTIDLRNEEIPEDAGLLVIANPRTDFERAAEGSNLRTEIERLRSYLDGGGSLFVSMDPFARKLTVFENFIAEYGIRLATTESDGTLSRNIIKDSSSAITTDGFSLVTSYAEGELASAISEKVARYDGGRVIVKYASALTLDGDAKPLLTSSASSVCEANGKTVDTSGNYVVAAYTERAVGDGESAKLFVVPSVYIAASDALVSRGYSNKDFIYALFEELYGCTGLPYGCEPVLYDTSTLENLTMGTAKLYTALIMLVPVVLAGVACFVLIRRKNR